MIGADDDDDDDGDDDDDDDGERRRHLMKTSKWMASDGVGWSLSMSLPYGKQERERESLRKANKHLNRENQSPMPENAHDLGNKARPASRSFLY